MRCDDHMSRFLDLDNDGQLPLSTRLHLFICPNCRREIAALTLELTLLREQSAHYAHADMSSVIMDKIFALASAEEHTISNLKWLFVGFIMLSSTVLIGYSDTVMWLRVHFGPHLTVPLSIVMGLCFSLYAIMFVGTHVDELKKYWVSIARKIH